MIVNALSFHNNKSWYEPADKTKGFIRALTIMVFAFVSGALVRFFEKKLNCKKERSSVVLRNYI